MVHTKVAKGAGVHEGKLKGTPISHIAGIEQTGGVIPGTTGNRMYHTPIVNPSYGGSRINGEGGWAEAAVPYRYRIGVGGIGPRWGGLLRRLATEEKRNGYND